MQLNIPNDNISVDASVPNNARQVKKWLKELPVANIGETTRLFYTTVAKINRQSIAARERVEIMEIMRPTSHIVLKNLSKYLVARTFPLPAKTRKIMQLTQAVLGELALGYKIVVQDSSFGDARLDAKSATLCIHRALRTLGEQLQISAQVYTPDPKGVWLDVHQLYKFAEDHRLLKKSVSDDTYVDIAASNVADAYKQICLLALARPSSLRQGEASRLAAFFETACRKCDISRNSAPDSSDGVYFTLVKTDSPPGYIAASDLAISDDNRFFDLNGVCVELKEQIQRSKVGTTQAVIQKSALSSDLSRRLLANLTTMAKRRFSRAAKDYEVRVAIGLANIHRAIQNDDDPLEYQYSGGGGMEPDLDMQLELAPTGQEPENNPGYVIPPRTTTQPQHDEYVWDQVARGNVINDESLKNANPHRRNTGSAQNPDLWRLWKVVNSSAGGYGLLWEADETSKAQVGELLALREPEGATFSWRVGVLRWMQFNQDQELHAGVQLLAPKTMLVTIHRSDLSRPRVDPVNSLMLPGIKTIDQPPTILAPTGIFSQGEDVNLEVLEQQRKIKLTEVVEQTGAFCQYRYINLDTKQTAAENSPADAPTKDDSFDSLWSEL